MHEAPISRSLGFVEFGASGMQARGDPPKFDPPHDGRRCSGRRATRQSGVGHDVGLWCDIGVTPVRTVTSRTLDFRAAAESGTRQTAEASMSKTIHRTLIVTPFGSGYVPEDHRPEHGAVLEEPKKRGGRLAI